MSSRLLDLSTNFLLECDMDFRDNWFDHFRRVVDQEIANAGGSAVAGRKVVGANLEKGEQTIYQHYTQKSGKKWPTVEMMVMLEKKYGEGRAPGWSALPIVTVLEAKKSPDVQGSLKVLHEKVQNLAPESRAEVKTLFDLYLGSPVKYEKLMIDIQGHLLGEIAPTQDEMRAQSGAR